MGFNKLKINYGRLMQVYFQSNGGVQGHHYFQNPSEEKTEGIISGIDIIATVGASKRIMEKLFLAVCPRRLRNSQ